MQHLFRRLFKSPSFTAITLLTLAIGIGANTAVFSVVQGVLLKPLPYPRPGELVSVRHTAPGIKLPDVPMAPSNYFTYRDESSTLQDLGMWTRDSVSVTGLAEPEQVDALNVTEETLPILGVQAILGRNFSAKDCQSGSPRTAMLAYGYWQRKFAGDHGVIGRSVRLDGELSQIIGVLPEKFHLGRRDVAILTPLQFNRASLNLGQFGFEAVGRLKPGVTVAQATADLTRLVPVTFAKYPAPRGATLAMFESARLAPVIVPLKEHVIGDIGSLLWVLMGTIGIVLLIACANVANLLLVRAEGRQHELAIRAALGAGWQRIAGDLMLESVALGVAGGLLGIAVAYGAVRVLVAMAPAGLPRLEEIGIDATVLAFALAVSIVAGVLFGLIPVLKYAGPHIAGTIRHGGRNSSQSRERHRARSTLVVAQVALALVLLIGSGLMIRTFQSMRKVNPGFVRPEQVQTLTLSIENAHAKEAEQVIRMQDAIRQKLAAVPGVTSVSFARDVPMSGGSSSDPVFAEDQQTAEGKLPQIRRFKFMAPGFLATMGNPLVAGRDYTWDDLYSLRPVAIVTENLAREFWGSPSAALGKRIRESMAGPWREVIGVAGNERDDGVEKPAPTAVYWPIYGKGMWGEPFLTRRTATYVVRSTRTGSQGFVNELRQAVWSVNPDLPLASVRTLEDLYARSMARTSFALTMLAIAGGMALLLGVIGIYGVISYSVSQRTREIGIRMALGAQQQTLTGMFVRHGLRLAAIGVVLGLAAAYALTKAMSSLLFGISAADPVTYAAVALGLGLAAAVASYVPSRRATAVDPMEALRAE
jgi:putative ABC transport system permease protein